MSLMLKESRSFPRNRMRAWLTAFFGQDAQIARAIVVFPQPNSPTMPSGLAFADRVRHPVDGMQVTPAGTEAHPQSIEFDVVIHSPAIWD